MHNGFGFAQSHYPSKSNLDCEHGINCTEIYWPADATAYSLQGTAVNTEIHFERLDSHPPPEQGCAVILLLLAIYN